MTRPAGLYECDVCGALYDNWQTASLCQDRGAPKLPEVGTLFGWAGWPQAVLVVTVVYAEGHSFATLATMFRDDGHPDAQKVSGAAPGYAPDSGSVSWAPVSLIPARVRAEAFARTLKKG